VRRLRAAVVGDVSADGRAPAPRADAVLGRAPVRLAPAEVGPDGRVRVRVSRRAAEALTPGVPWWADSAHWGAEVVRWTESTRAPVVVDAGDTVTLAAPPLPAALPEALKRRGVRWFADGAAAIADAPRAAGAARVVARAPGEAHVVALGPAGREVIPVRVRAAVRGRVYAVGADGSLGVVAARVVVRRRDASRADTLRTDARAASAPRSPTAGPASPTCASSRSATTTKPSHSPRSTPTRCTRSASCSRRRAGPSRRASTRAPWSRCARPRRAASGAPPAAGRPVGWATDAARSVAFDPGARTAFDTAAFWSAARGLGRAWGRPLFRPAADGESADVTVALAPGLPAAGMTTLSYDGSGVVAGARVEFRSASAAADPRVAAHELLHALGFGHARGWSSLVGLAGYGGPETATPADVAHGQLLEAVRRAAREAEREYGAAFGWAGGRP
jgi:hypothetical protein